MRAAIAVLALAGCKTILGIDDTSVPPDAPIENRIVDVGDGSDGPIVVVANGFTDDVRAGITATVGEGSTLVQVTSSDGFAVGDEVVLIQMTGDLAGHYETGRVRSSAPGSITLERAVGSAFPAEPTTASQVIHVPNFSSVTIGSTGRLGAHAWDGVTGGVVFFRVSGALGVDPGGVITADATGFGGGIASLATVGGTGGTGGNGGAHLNCPALGCGLNAQNAQSGSTGSFTAAAAGDVGAQNQLCHAGAGGAGGTSGSAADPPLPGEPGQGFGGAVVASGGGGNVTLGITQPLLGGGGAGGTGGIGGIGGAGGGGGGGPVAGNNPAGQGDGSPGGKGLDGGDGGAAGGGGAGGGIVIIQASTILLSGEISAGGGAGVAGTDGVLGGIGGFGGFSGGAPTCAGASIPGGRGGGGAGAQGGAGGSGGGGGAGGVIQLAAEELHVTGMVRALGGAGSAAGGGGMGGAGGNGFGDPDVPAASGPSGPAGGSGSAGSPGFVYISFVDICDGCGDASDPAAGLTDL